MSAIALRLAERYCRPDGAFRKRRNERKACRFRARIAVSKNR
jgi:hypothetical protein